MSIKHNTNMEIDPAWSGVTAGVIKALHDALAKSISAYISIDDPTADLETYLREAYEATRDDPNEQAVAVEVMAWVLGKRYE